jgi:hypothetical protein
MPRGRPRYTSIEEAEPVWYKNTKASGDVWANRTSTPSAFDHYVKSMAKLLGLSEAEVRASLPASNWKDFQGKASVKKTDYLTGVEDAFKEKRWSTKLKEAYTKKPV